MCGRGRERGDECGFEGGLFGAGSLGVRVETGGVFVDVENGGCLDGRETGGWVETERERIYVRGERCGGDEAGEYVSVVCGWCAVCPAGDAGAEGGGWGFECCCGHFGLGYGRGRWGS